MIALFSRNIIIYFKVEEEETVFESVLAWLMHDIANRASSISEVFSYVRFALMNEDYLENCIAHVRTNKA